MSAICSKASKTLRYLRRNLRNSPPNVRKSAYLSFVRTQLEFASAVWSPHQGYLISMLEGIQNRAARFISRNYARHTSVTQLKLDISLQELDIRRTISLLCLFHRYVHNDTSHFLPLHTPERTSSRLHNKFSFKRVFGKTKAFNSSAFPRAITLWNSLPDDIAMLSNRDAFREKLHALYD